MFIYALSPGLDMVFSSSKEVETLKNKIKQVCTVLLTVAGGLVGYRKHYNIQQLISLDNGGFNLLVTLPL